MTFKLAIQKAKISTEEYHGPKNIHRGMHAIICTVSTDATHLSICNNTIYKKAIRQAPVEPKDCCNAQKLYIPDVWICEAILNYPI